VRVHFIGVSGTAMAGVALMMRKLGHTVQGSDTAFYPPMGPMLKEQGVATLTGYRPENITPDLNLVVVGNVCRRDNPEVVEAQRLGLLLLSMPQVIERFFLADKHALVVTGTHGKTSTTALLAWMLEEAGMDPSFMVGGIALNFQSNHKIGDGSYFVIEGDEYDTAFFDKKAKFFHYKPLHAAITSLEYDHADIYPDLSSIEQTFHSFAEMIPVQGSLSCCTDWPVLWRIADACAGEVVRYGTDETALVAARQMSAGESGTTFQLTLDGGQRWHDATLALWGRHNVLNSLAAASLASRAGADVESIVRAMATFKGVWRRMQVWAQAADVTIVDDFAHHPTAVTETLKACVSRFPGRRVLAVYHFESNTSRRRIFQAEYGQAFRGAQAVFLTHPLVKADALSADQYLDPFEVVARVREYADHAGAWSDFQGICDAIVAYAKPGDVVLGMSGRDLSPLYELLVPALQASRER